MAGIVDRKLQELGIVLQEPRAPMANYGLDQINGMAALYLAIGPSGRVLSIDRLRERAIRQCQCASPCAGG